MTCPSRKNQMVKQIMKNKKIKEKQEIKPEEKITEEEHQERIKKLKEMGLI